MAKTLDRLASAGAEDFYRGELAELIAAELARGGGSVTLDDLRGYRVRVVAPLEGRFRGLTVLSSTPPGGGVTMLQMLHVLDRFAPLTLGYPPADAEAKLLAARHPELPAGLIDDLVRVANAIRGSQDLRGGLSVRATDEACVYLKHPVFESDQRRSLPEILKSSFCGRFSTRNIRSAAAIRSGIAASAASTCASRSRASSTASASGYSSAAGCASNHSPSRATARETESRRSAARLAVTRNR